MTNSMERLGLSIRKSTFTAFFLGISTISSKFTNCGDNIINNAYSSYRVDDVCNKGSIVLQKGSDDKKTYNIKCDMQTTLNSYNNVEDKGRCSVAVNLSMKHSLEKIQTFKELEYNWDSYGAEPIGDHVIKSAEKLVLELDVEPEIYPTARESIQFEYDFDDSGYIEVEIFYDRYKVYQIEADGTEKEFECGIEEVQKVAMILNGFIERII